MTKNRKLALAAALIVLIGGAATAFALMSGPPAPDADLDKVVAFAAGEDFAKLDPDRQREYGQRLMRDRRDLREVEGGRDAVRNVFQTMVQQRVDGYYAAEDKDAYLDGIIDEMQAMRDEWRNRHEERQASDDRPTTRPRGEGREGRGGGWRGGFGGGDRGAGGNGVEQAKRVEFMKALGQRMRDRGMSMGRGPGGPGRR